MQFDIRNGEAAEITSVRVSDNIVIQDIYHSQYIDVEFNTHEDAMELYVDDIDNMIAALQKVKELRKLNELSKPS